MSEQFNYLDMFKPEDIAVSKVWEVVSAMLFKGMQPSQVQRDEMRRAFYVGFTENFKIMNDVSDRLTEDQACDVLTRINKELREFHDAEIARMTPTRGSA